MKKKMTVEEYYHKREKIRQNYKLRQIKTGQEAQKLLNELETEFTGKKR